MKPERLSLDPNRADAELNWNHWRKMLNNFFTKLANITDQDKHALLINILSADVYNYVSEASSFADTITALEKLCET